MEKYLFLFATVIGICALGWFVLHLLPGKSITEKTWPRFYGWLVVTVFLFAALYVISPQQAEVVFYKFALATGGALLGCLLDRLIFPYARPDGYLTKFWQDRPPTWEITAIQRGEADHEVVAGYENIFALAMIRRAVIIVAVTVSVTLGM